MTCHITAAAESDPLHGGTRRSLQICAVAESRGRRVVRTISGRSPKAMGRLLLSPFCLFKTACLIIKIGLVHFSVRGVYAALIHGVWLYQTNSLSERDEIWIELSAGKCMVLAALLSALKVKYVAFPHNIEFLVPNQNQEFFRNSAMAFAIEKKIYCGASRVYTISSFDRAVIRCLGVDRVEVLRYQPPDTIIPDLLRIRKNRINTHKEGILIIGSIGNTPTRKGVGCLLDKIRSANRFGKKFILAGFGTEIFLDTAPKNCEVLGSVGNEKLLDLLARCEGLLISHPQSSGMLTRIVEAEIAGVPVFILGDYLQASEDQFSGVRVIESLDQLPS